jgi:hypothetical protein
MALHGRNTLKALQHGVDTLTPFTAGNVKGVVGDTDTGQMPDEIAQYYRVSAREGAIAYTVLSYATPIAWRLIDGRWVQPVVRYSVTTTGHQSRVAAAIGSYLTIPAR